DTDQQNPYFLAVVVETDEIRTFPYAVMRADTFAEFAQLCPILEVRRRIERNGLPGGQGHDPLTCLLVPHHLGVPEIANTGVGQHGVTLVFCPCLSVVGTVGDALVLVTSGFFAFYFMVMVGEYGYQRIAAEPGRIV